MDGERRYTHHGGEGVMSVHPLRVEFLLTALEDGVPIHYDVNVTVARPGGPTPDVDGMEQAARHVVGLFTRGRRVISHSHFAIVANGDDEWAFKWELLTGGEQDGNPAPVGDRPGACG